ncbi:BON domain-containing protein [Telluria aromaticivorans]|uniref:Osmotically-inducible protein Y n=1 Tax=Telluria aromaticivorans TaxID=2725995 RepID=A0A7Y2JXD2_9BURK|nr:BON domain-containing protein [Telluria aromaticivorans]NNG22770.1 BON domain-containing protein [Telluria aromaticivorans]
MNKLLATLLATAVGATIAAAPAFAQKSDTAGYRTAMDKIAADHKAAKQKCDALKDEDVCEEQADVMRARAEADAVAKYDNTPANRDAARRKLAEAEYELAEEKCDTMKGNQKDSCMATAKSARTAALANTKASRDTAMGRSAAGATAAGAAAATKADTKADTDGGLIASTDTKDPVKAAAVEKCEQQGSKTACVVENDSRKVATSAERAGDKTRMAAADAGDRTEAAAATAAAKTERAGERGVANVSDAMITTKVKAGLVKAPNTSALAIKVETEKGVVMLSGFAESKAEVERAEQVAKGVEGVTRVKNSIKVK